MKVPPRGGEDSVAWGFGGLGILAPDAGVLGRDQSVQPLRRPSVGAGTAARRGSGRTTAMLTAPASRPDRPGRRGQTGPAGPRRPAGAPASTQQKDQPDRVGPAWRGSGAGVRRRTLCGPSKRLADGEQTTGTDECQGRPTTRLLLARTGSLSERGQRPAVVVRRAACPPSRAEPDLSPIACCRSGRNRESRRDAAVQWEGCACDEAGVIAGEIRHRAGNLL